MENYCRSLRKFEDVSCLFSFSVLAISILSVAAPGKWNLARSCNPVWEIAVQEILLNRMNHRVLLVFFSSDWHYRRYWLKPRPQLVQANQITYNTLVKNAVAGTVFSGQQTGTFTTSVNPSQVYAVVFYSTALGVSTVTSIKQRFSSGGNRLQGFNVLIASLLNNERNARFRFLHWLLLLK